MLFFCFIIKFNLKKKTQLFLINKIRLYYVKSRINLTLQGSTITPSQPQVLDNKECKLWTTHHQNNKLSTSSPR